MKDFGILRKKSMKMRKFLEIIIILDLLEALLIMRKINF